MAGPLNGARKLKATPQVKLCSVPTISSHTHLRDRLETVALKGLELFGTHKALAPKFDKLTVILDEDSLSGRFFDHSKLPKHIDNLEKQLEHKVQDTQINNRRINRLAEKAQGPLQGILDIFDNTANGKLPATNTSPLNSVEKVLADIAFREESEEVLEALRFLERGNLNHLYKRYVRELTKRPTPRYKIAGIVAELRAILHLSRDKNIEIVDANARVSHVRTRHEIEFFDIIARDRRADRFILFEIKRDKEYSVGDFMYQFLGIGGSQKETSRKPLSQIDVLMHPEKFHIPTKYSQDITDGNYEVQVLMHTQLYDFAPLYARPKKLYELFNYLCLPGTPIFFAKNTFEILTRSEIRTKIHDLRRQIETGQRPGLGNILIKFKVMPWY